MKVAIIGGGWVGCHLAFKLKNQHEVVIYEKNDSLFHGTSFKNQNRLHLGFHYARNSKTRELCLNTFNKFLTDYSFCTENVSKNYYCVPKKSSLIDYNTYLKIFEDFNVNNVNLPFNSIEGCIDTNEKFLNFECFHDFFNQQLKDIIIFEEITKSKIKKLSNKYDLVIDATNNFLGLINDDFFYELTLTLIYEKIKPTEFNAITLVDGDLFSIYPYKENKFTLTDVELTPLGKFKSVKSLETFKEKIDISFLDKKITKFEQKVQKILPNFKENFIYDSHFLSIKSKINDESGNRYPVIKKTNNIISCFTGKIQGIYIIEDYVKNIINHEENTNLF
jgi:hypothetical protein